MKNQLTRALSNFLTLAAPLGLASCVGSERYVVDAALLQRVEEADPDPVKVSANRWRVGHAEVEVECTAPPNHYRAVVFGAAGRWRGQIDAPISHGGSPCDDPSASLDVAAEAARIYREARGVIPAIRASDGRETHLRVRSIDSDSIERDGPRATVVASARRDWFIPGNILLGCGLTLAAIGGALVLSDQSGPIDTATSKSGPSIQIFDSDYGKALLIPAAAMTVLGAIFDLVALRSHDQEAPPDEEHLLYFGNWLTIG